MMGRVVSVLAVVLPAVVSMGCTKEMKAKKALETYVVIFQTCRDETEKAKMKPGEHGCSAIASAAVDLGIEATQVEMPKRQEMLKSWLEAKGFAPYYLSPDKRPAAGGK